MSHGRRTCATWPRILVLCLLSTLSQADPPNHTLEDSLKYITRPDIEVPRWNITIYDHDRVAPGYWFVEPYDYLDQSLVNGGKWTAPMIFDERGELVWSGAYLSQQYNSFDFRMNNVMGQDLITWLYDHNRTAILMDTHFNIIRTFQTSSFEDELPNMHDLQFVGNGTRALYFYDETRNASQSQSAAIGFTEWDCPIRENSIRELDLKTDEIVFSWSSSDHIGLTESTFTERSVEDRCVNMEKGWDYIHCNSIDKFSTGDYLMSARYTDTIYKISPEGDIIWRLGGMKSDFEADFKFARQHHARILKDNSTLTILSFLDNAKAEEYEESVAPYSRGVIVALEKNVQPMRATLLHEYPHPGGVGAYLMGRGSVQVLPNGNVFSCWVNGCHHVEYTVEGEIVMEAHVKQGWLKSYRSYKFPFVGLPAAPPDIHSATYLNDGQVTTVVHASWNGATEVAEWLLYTTNHAGNNETFLTSSLRTSFETTLNHTGYAKYTFVEARDHTGQRLGRSKVAEALVTSPLPVEIVAEEERRLGEQHSKAESWTAKAKSAAGSRSAISAYWIISGIALILGIRIGYRASRKGTRWWSGMPLSYEMAKIGKMRSLDDR